MCAATRDFLLSLRNHQGLAHTVLLALKSLGILKHRSLRGLRGSRWFPHLVTWQRGRSSYAIPASQSYGIPVRISSTRRPVQTHRQHQDRSMRFMTFVPPSCPADSSLYKVALLNARSVRKKTTILNEFLTENRIDLLKRGLTMPLAQQSLVCYPQDF